MRRRVLLASTAGAALLPDSARAQQPAIRTVGFISSLTSAAARTPVAAFQAGLMEIGYLDGRDVAVEYRFAEGRFERFPALVSELIRRPVDVLVVTSLDGTRVAKEERTTIPVVFSVGVDPVAAGLITSLSRPGGNMTGVYQFTSALEAKRLALLHEVVPWASTIAVLINPSFSGAQSQEHEVQEAALRLGVKLVVVQADVDGDLDGAFATAVAHGSGAIQVCASPFFHSRHEQLVAKAARHALPAVYEWRDFAAVGGLMSYGTSLADAYRQTGVYAGRILKGAKPEALPVMQTIKFEFIVNLATAKALGLTVPPSLLARADGVIE